MTDFTDEDVERGWDALEAAHEATYHVHAAECCIETDKYVRSVLAAVLPEYAKRVRAEALREAADDLVPADVWTPEECIRWLRARADAEGRKR